MSTTVENNEQIFAFIERLAKSGQQDLSDQCALAHYRFMCEDRLGPAEAKAGPAWSQPGHVFASWDALQTARSEGLTITAEAELRRRVLNITPTDEPFTANDLKEHLFSKAKTDPDGYGLQDGDWSLVYRNTEEPVFVYVMAIGMTCHALEDEGVFVRGEGKNCRTYRLASGLEDHLNQMVEHQSSGYGHGEYIAAAQGTKASTS
jgi:hypothetical protein